ncbi:MAG: PilW family protein [Saccharospirillum sp.]
MRHRIKATVHGRASVQSGLSLVELMIAMALGLVLTLGVIQVFTSASQTYRLTDRVAQLQEDMRYILGRLQYEGRIAGNRGCLIGTPDIRLDTSDAAFTAVQNISFSGAAVVGWEAEDSGLGDAIDFGGTVTTDAYLNGGGQALPATAQANALPGSDVFVLNGVIRQNLDVTGAGGNNINTVQTSTNIAQNRIVIAVTNDCTGGDIFQKRNANNSSGISAGAGSGGNPGPGNVNQAINGSAWTYGAGASIYEYYSTLYFIGTGANGDPALFSQRLEYENAPVQELVSGVENLQVLYGVSSGAGTPVASEYVTAEAVTDWDDVVSMRIALLMRSANPVQDEDEAVTYSVLGTAVTTDADRLARLLGSTTVAIRNQLQ